MTQEDNIIVPRWFLENVEDTLRIQNNINLDKETGETCQDRNVRQSLNGPRKLLKGEELTGRERLEKLQPSLLSNLDEAAEKEIERFCSDMLNVDIIWARMPLTKKFGLQMPKFGAEWVAGQR